MFLPFFLYHILMSDAMEFPIISNFKVKVFTFLLATLFWFVIVTENDYSHEFDVRLQIENIPPGKVIVNDVPEYVKIRMEGGGKFLFSLLFFGDASIVIDLSEADNQFEAEIKPTMVHFPRLQAGASVQSIVYPAKIEIKLDDLQFKRLPIKNNIEVTTEDGYMLVGEMDLIPDSIVISGPSKSLQAVHSIATEPLVFNDIDENVTGEIELNRFADSLKIRMGMSSVNYRLNVQKLLEYRFSEIPIHVLNTPVSAQITPLPSTATLTIVGGEKYLLELNPKDLYLYVDYNEIHNLTDNSKQGIPVQFRPIDDVEISEIYPSHITLEKRKMLQ